MKENPVDSGQCDWSNLASKRQLRNGRARLLVTRSIPLRVIAGALALLVLLLSAMSFFLVAQNTYAQTGNSSVAAAACTPTATPTTVINTPTQTLPGMNPTPTPKPTQKPTPTPKPTQKPTPSPTPTPVTPTPTPVTPTPTDTPTTTVTPDGGGGSASVTPTEDATATIEMLNSIVDCTPTPMPTETAVAGGAGTDETPGAGATSTPSPSDGGTPGSNTSSGAFPMNIVMIVGLVLLGLLLSAGIGWFVFRRMLLPANEVKLPPSGAHPWSRTRGPVSDHAINTTQQAGAFGSAGNAAQGPLHSNTQHGFEPQFNYGVVPLSGNAMPNAPVTGALNGGFENTLQGFEPAAQGLHTPPPAGFTHNRAGSGQLPNTFPATSKSFSGSLNEGFAPPSSQTFAQNDFSMIPPGSGAFPVVNNGGYSPASSAFNAMYGLPGEPFNTPQQSNSPTWMQNLERDNRRQRNTSGSSFSNAQQPPQPPQKPPVQQPQSSAGFSATENFNDPYLAEVIRQYSQKSQAVRPPQPQRRPNNGPDSSWIK